MPLWDQLPTEPDRWYNRFDRYYRPLSEERTIEAAWQDWQQKTAKNSKSKRPPRQWRDIAETWQWKERARAWDAEQRRKRLVSEQRQIDEANQRHKKLGTSLQGLGTQGLKLLMENPDDLKPGDVRLLIQTGIQIEREALGLPSEILKIMVMSDEDLLSTYHQLLETVTNRRGSDEATWDTAASTESDE